ncbi:MAG TPA: RagB/SusD family nutrient uptake outer membrane protein [Bacteroidales bacterium]|nr:RagB/SusD family nutrient uptake outer membrane protein [Bacteroidales bacterium]
MKKTLKYTIALVACMMMAFQSCTDLEEETYDQVPVDKYGTTQEQINSLLAPMYIALRSVFPGSYWEMSELSSDMSLMPTRKGGDWWDGGVYKELRTHTWDAENDIVKSVYNSIWSNIAQCNQIYYMIDISNVADKERTLAEIRGFRAYWYYLLIDNFGNVPIVTDFLNADAKPATKTRKEVYNFVLGELNAVKDLLREDVMNTSKSSYNRMTKGVAYTLLAKLYLNAMVWNPDGGPKWQECIEACDKVESLGYTLEPVWKTNFQVTNEVSKEAILSAVFRKSDNWWAGNNLARKTLHYLDARALGLQLNCSNGICAMPAFVSSFDPADKRLEGSYLIGAMLDPANGDTIVTAHGRPLVHTIAVTKKYNLETNPAPYGWGQCEQEDGARCYKWVFENALTGAMENDYHIFRYSDVLLMEAEARIRKDGPNGESDNLINQIRSRAFNGNPSKFLQNATLNDVYKERRFELAWEAFGRQDQIRFGTYLDEIPGWKGTSDVRYLLFPIPQEALNANENLTQNPGY